MPYAVTAAAPRACRLCWPFRRLELLRKKLSEALPPPLPFPLELLELPLLPLLPPLPFPLELLGGEKMLAVGEGPG